MKSRRDDGRGHWPAGKYRSALTAAQRASVIRRIRKAVEQLESIRAVARTLGVSDRSVRRLLAGEDQPTERMRELLNRLPVHPKTD